MASTSAVVAIVERMIERLRKEHPEKDYKKKPPKPKKKKKEKLN